MTTNYIIRHISSGLVLEPDGEVVVLQRRSNSFLQLWKIEPATQDSTANVIVNHDLW